MGYRGNWSDGRSAARHEVTVEFADDALVLHALDGTSLARWEFGEIVLLDEPVPGTLRLGRTVTPDARLVVDDAAFAHALRERTPHLSLARRAARRRWLMAAMLIFLAPLVAAGAGWALQRAAQALAPLVPLAWERPLGDYARTQLVEGHRVCDADAGRAALAHLAMRLGAAADRSVPFDVQVVDIDVTNAFALPGGAIVVFDRLVRRARSPDELAGVLAHEMAHVIHRDPTQAVLRSVGFTLLVRSLLGGAPGAQLGGVLFQLANSRSAEEAADREALAILRRAGLRTDGLAKFFDRLEQEAPSDSSMPTILSTHPPTPERRAAVTTDDHGGQPALDRAAWAAVRRICAP